MRTTENWDWARVHGLALGETRRVLGVGSEAEDAAQEATIRAWRRRATCHGAPAAWVRAIARNEALRVIDRRRDEAPLEAADGVRREPASMTDAHAVRAAVRELDE